MRRAELLSGGAVLLLLAALGAAARDSPTVNIYTRTPLAPGEQNQVICHCSGFHPPLIEIRLMKNGRELEGCSETDLSFRKDWKYFKTKYADITPEEGAVYECEVRHDNGLTHTHRLESFD